MEVIEEYPPNYKEIEKHFDISKDEKIVFTYGNKIYNPHKTEIPEHLVEHEAVHCRQQGDDPESWWKRYFVDKDFRLEQELEAYKTQWAFAKPLLNNQGQKIFLQVIASDLSSKMYGNIISFDKALTIIRKSA